MLEGGAIISVNGKPEFFIQTTVERKAELARREESEQIGVMLKLVELSKKSIKNGEGITAEELLLQRKKARSR